MAKAENVSKLEREIGLRIGKLRDAAGISQQKFADEMGVSRPVIQHWESGTRHIKADNLISIAKYFNVSSDYLLGLTDVESPSTNDRAICEYMGLTHEALKNWKDEIQNCTFFSDARVFDVEHPYMPIDLVNDMLSDEFIGWALPPIVQFCDGITGIKNFPTSEDMEEYENNESIVENFNTKYNSAGLFAVRSWEYSMYCAKNGGHNLSQVFEILCDDYIDKADNVHYANSKHRRPALDK